MRKVLAATLTCLIVLLWAIPSFAQTTPQGKFDVRLKLKSSDCIAKKVVLQVQVKAHDANSTFMLGDANFRFDYDPAVVINPKNISQENFSNAAPASDANYSAQTLTGSKVSTDGTKGIVSLNVLYSGSNAGAKQVGIDYITVACIQFDILKSDGCVNFKWHTDNTVTDFPVTGMNEIIITSPDPYDYTNPTVAAGGIFESYNVCLNTLCVAPVINNDAVATTMNTAVSGNVLTNDTPTGGLTVKISPFPTPLHGSLSLSTNGNFTYTPATGYVGKDSIQYEACDANNVCGKAWVVFTTTGPALAVNRDVASTTINTAVSGNVLTNDSPTGGLTVKISPFPTPLHGSLSLSTNGNFTYTPSTGYVGKDSIQYEACDANNNCAKAWAVFTITGPAPVVTKDVYSTNINTAVSGNVLANDTPVGGLTVKIVPLPTPLHGSLSLSTNGNFTYTPVTGYVGKDSIQYEACDGNNVCAKAWVVFTVIDNSPAKIVDLALIKTVSTKKTVVGDLITFTVSITNQSLNVATGVSVKDYMPAGVLFKSYFTSTGTYNNTTGIWTIGNVAAQQTINLVITVQAQGEGTFFNRAEVWTCNEVDADSRPANTLLGTQSTNNGQYPANPVLEDDNASACFYVPIGLCTGSGDTYEISVPTGYTGIQWYKDGSPIQGATATTFVVTTVGSYTFTTLEGTCPAGGCCPAEFVPIDCCKPAICVPYAVVKTKSAKK